MLPIMRALCNTIGDSPSLCAYITILDNVKKPVFNLEPP